MRRAGAQGEGADYALSTLVVMEMLKALSAVSLTQSMIKISPWTSPILIAGVTVPFLLHLMVRPPFRYLDNPFRANLTPYPFTSYITLSGALTLCL